jgi:hypothetical protein
MGRAPEFCQRSHCSWREEDLPRSGFPQTCSHIRADHCATLERTYCPERSISGLPHRRVYEELKERALCLPLNVGLGSEKALCRELGVGRWALRHGLQLLRDEGLVRTAPGQGTFVVKRSARDADECDASLG